MEALAIEMVATVTAAAATIAIVTRLLAMLLLTEAVMTTEVVVRLAIGAISVMTATHPAHLLRGRCPLTSPATRRLRMTGSATRWRITGCGGSIVAPVAKGLQEKSSTRTR